MGSNPTPSARTVYDFQFYKIEFAADRQTRIRLPFAAGCGRRTPAGRTAGENKTLAPADKYGAPHGLLPWLVAAARAPPTTMAPVSRVAPGCGAGRPAARAEMEEPV